MYYKCHKGKYTKDDTVQLMIVVVIPVMIVVVIPVFITS